MGSSQENILRVLLRNGTDQSERKGQLTDPESVRLHGFDVKEWMQFAHSFATRVNFYSKENHEVPSGNWYNFFKKDEELEELLEKLDSEHTLTPHLTLFICFLRLMELPKKSLNNLTKRHLDFYYGKILKLEKLPAKADRVHLIFELAKNTPLPFLIEAGTEADGDKDALGNNRIYKLENELAVYNTTVAQLKNIYNPPNVLDNDGNIVLENPIIKSSSVANSSDGKGAELDPDSPSWFPFGYYDPEGLLKLTELPDAKLGFAVSSNVLALAEGNRVIKTVLTFNRNVNGALANEDPLTDITPEQLAENITFMVTGESGWIGTTNLSNTIISGHSITLETTLEADEKAVVAYDPTIHGEQFQTENPLLRFSIQTNNADGYRIYERFTDSRWNLNKINVEVNVTGIKSLILNNDQSQLNEKKPFYPFTTQPKAGSGFTVYNEEAFSKKWSKIELQFDWKNTPSDFKNWYVAYADSFKIDISKEKFATRLKDNDFLDLTSNGKKGNKVDPFKGIVDSNNYFTAKPAYFSKEEWQPLGNSKILFTKTGDIFHFAFDTSENEPNSHGPSGPIRFKMNQSFLHELYPRLYALAIMNIANDSATIIPNEPYTPFAENILLNYIADDELILTDNSEKEFTSRTLQLFHEHPHGQTEEHPYIRSNTFDPLMDQDCLIFPTYEKGGELYIGLESAEVLQQVSLLIQVNEGSENPLSPTFQMGEKVQWDILCSDFWKPLDSALMVVNEIDNFLKSGILKFTIPKIATSNNSMLPTGLFWIRAKTNKPFDSVCKVLGIHAQAAIAVFEDHENELSHLEKGLANGTITKLVERLGQVKSVQQPYNSFDGKPKETDMQFYQRVSERLRHKNRAITLWDYEHLVLQEFPSIYKVKCLNHTCTDSYGCGGNVTLVVVPDTTRNNLFDNYRPRVSKATLNKVKAYIKPLQSLHIELNVMNPDYEEVKVEVAVKFNSGFDENLYRQKLNEDITKLLSPWAFDAKAPITFGVSLHKSSLIHYIEKLDYIDYVDELLLFQNGNPKKVSCEPGTPKSILVSARQHTINITAKVCASNNIISEECQP